MAPRNQDESESGCPSEETAAPSKSLVTSELLSPTDNKELSPHGGLSGFVETSPSSKLELSTPGWQIFTSGTRTLTLAASGAPKEWVICPGYLEWLYTRSLSVVMEQLGESDTRLESEFDDSRKLSSWLSDAKEFNVGLTSSSSSVSPVIFLTSASHAASSSAQSEMRESSRSEPVSPLLCCCCCCCGCCCCCCWLEFSLLSFEILGVSFVNGTSSSLLVAFTSLLASWANGDLVLARYLSLNLLYLAAPLLLLRRRNLRWRPFFGDSYPEASSTCQTMSSCGNKGFDLEIMWEWGFAEHRSSSCINEGTLLLIWESGLLSTRFCFTRGFLFEHREWLSDLELLGLEYTNADEEGVSVAVCSSKVFRELVGEVEWTMTEGLQDGTGLLLCMVIAPGFWDSKLTTVTWILEGVESVKYNQRLLYRTRLTRLYWIYWCFEIKDYRDWNYQVIVPEIQFSITDVHLQIITVSRL